MSWRTRWRVYEYVRNSLWIVPALFVLIAIALGIALPEIDESTSTTVGIDFGADASRSVLGAMAGGMITFTGFVFSILLLAVQFGSSQFSPRMLRRFLRDPTTKVALGIFMATFVYSLVVLRVVGTAANEDFVPDNSIAVALLMLLLSMLMFLRLISRTTQGLRVAAVLNDLGRDARGTVDRVYPEPADPDEDRAAGGGGGTTSGSVASNTAGVGEATTGGAVRTVEHGDEPGVLQSVDFKGLVARAASADATIELVPRVGDLIAPGTPLFRVYGDGGAIEDGWLRGAVAIGDERTMRQDPAFAFRLIADISAKALSPGVNDPTTAIQALDQIELLLRQVGGRRLTPGVARDEAGTVRFRYPAPSWEDFVGLALDETRQYGSDSVQVTRRLRALLEDLREAVPPPRRAALDAQLALLDSGADRAFADSGDRAAAGTRDRQGLGAGDPPGVK
jgi:uncharacterized membrane protein